MGLVWSFDTHTHADIFAEELPRFLFRRRLQRLCAATGPWRCCAFTRIKSPTSAQRCLFPCVAWGAGGWIALDKCWGNLWHLWLWNMLNTNTIPKKSPHVCSTLMKRPSFEHISYFIKGRLFAKSLSLLENFWKPHSIWCRETRKQPQRSVMTLLIVFMLPR